VAPLARPESFDRPIFILAAPRSGSSFLYECLCQFDDLVHLEGEADPIWWRHFPYPAAMGASDHVAVDAVTVEALQSFARDLYRAAVISWTRRRARWSAPLHLAGIRPIRYLDKTVANCFHLEVLERLFPDARYVFLIRDPRANIASMIEGWPQLERFGKPRLSPLLRRQAARTIEHWTYPAPPGWQHVVDRPLAEICAWSWQQHVESALSFCARRAGDVIQVRYEELAEDPLPVVREIAAKLGLRWSADVARYVSAAPLSRTTVTHPSQGKWQVKYANEIARILPQVQATARRIGYELETMAPEPARRGDGDCLSRTTPA
jgi:LPS sulfotransferase NodH